MNGRSLPTCGLLYTYMFTHPGGKLLFMGNEFAQTQEWNYKSELDWDLLQHVSHGGMKFCVQKLNDLYRNEPALHQLQFSPEGFEWVDVNHRAEAVVVYKRKGLEPKDDVLIILNFTPVVRRDWPVTAYGKESWKEIFNSDSKEFWGTGDVYNPDIQCRLEDKEVGRYSLRLHIPALGGVVIK